MWEDWIPCQKDVRWNSREGHQMAELVGVQSNSNGEKNWKRLRLLFPFEWRRRRGLFLSDYWMMILSILLKNISRCSLLCQWMACPLAVGWKPRQNLSIKDTYRMILSENFCNDNNYYNGDVDGNEEIYVTKALPFITVSMANRSVGDGFSLIN